MQRYVYSKAAPGPTVRFYNIPQAFQSLSLGSTGDAVQRLQQQLFSLNLLKREDIQNSIGTYNEATRQAVIAAQRAMGYTSAQLIWQTAGSFMPVSVAAILLSCVAALVYMPGIYQVIFEALGVMKHSMEVSLGFLMLFAAIEIVLNLMISVMLCMPIRKISAYALIKE
jgi:hypothetical protein